MAAYKDGANASYDKFSDFIPTIWDGRLLSNLKEEEGLVKEMTREYEGSIKQFGDTVRIPGIDRITVADYNANNTSITYTSNDSNYLTVTVDAAKYWSTRVEDIEAAQSKPQFVNELMAEAAFAVAKNRENYLYASLVAASAASADSFGQAGGGSLGTLLLSNATLTDGNMYNNLVKAGEKFDDNMAPAEGRYIVLPSFCKSQLLADARFVGAGAAGADSARGKGFIGAVAGFNLYIKPRGYFKRTQTTTFDKGYIDLDTVTSTAVADADVGTGTVADDYKVVAGVKGAYAYVEQLAKTETLRLEGAFANGIRGLVLYGGGAIRPQWIFTGLVDDVDTAEA